MKRFTETDKWRDGWFRKLKPSVKLAFIYIVDNCDSAGVWDPDFELAEFAIGEQVAWDEVSSALADRLRVLPNGKWFLTRFLEFQYGELSAECRPHAKILQLLRSHGIPYKKGINKVSIPTGKEEDRTIQEKETPAITAEMIYEAYPRKEAKKAALKAIERAMAERDHTVLLAATKAFASATDRWPMQDRQFIPHPATWFNRGSFDDDPANWERTRTQSSGHDEAPVRVGSNLRLPSL